MKFVKLLRWLSVDLIDEWCHQWWHQAITWANNDPVLRCHMVSLGHNELNHYQAHEIKWQSQHRWPCNTPTRVGTFVKNLSEHSRSLLGIFLAATKQLYEWFSPSVRRKLDCVATGFIYDDAVNFTVDVCPSVCLSVTPFWLCSHHRIIMKFSGVITNDRSDVHAKGQGQRSKVKVTEVNTQLSRFRTLTPVWIHIWWWNDAQSLMLFRRGALLFFKVICQMSRSHG